MTSLVAMSYKTWLNCESVCVTLPLKTFENSPLFLFIHTAVTGLPCPVCGTSKVDLITQRPPFLSPPIMHLLTPLLLLLLLRPAESRRGPRSGTVERGAGGRVRGRGRAGVMRRQTQECKEYMEAGEKYLDCQDRQLTTVMQDWPKDIHHLLLARNKIQVHTD